MDCIQTKQQAFVDQHGRMRIFHGINIVDKNVHGEARTRFIVKSQDLLTDQDKAVLPPMYLDAWMADACQRAGFNLIRLGFNWVSVEPEPGQYNDAYLADICNFMDLCAARGIYVFLDLHQDLYTANASGEGDGAPPWATMMDGKKIRPMGAVWAEEYFVGKAVPAAFENFWNDTPYQGKGLQEYFAQMWQYVADKVKDKPALFGFDILNEPYPGKRGPQIFRKIIAKLVRAVLLGKGVSRRKLLRALGGDTAQMLDQFDEQTFHEVMCAGEKLVNAFDTQRYSPFLNRTAAAIREVTDRGILMVENCYYSNLGIPCTTPAITINGARAQNQCFAPHAYDLMVDTDDYQNANNARVATMFQEHRRTQERLQMPVLVGEWGGHAPGDNWLPHIDYLMDLFDRFQWSNTYYCYCDDFFQMPLLQHISRPYPMAVTGEILHYGYDCEKKLFELQYRQNQAQPVPTEIYLPRQYQTLHTQGHVTVANLEHSEACYVYVATMPGEHRIKIQM